MSNEPLASADHPSAAAPVQIYTFGRFRIEVAGQRLMRDDVVVPLTPKAFLTLIILVKNRDRAVSKDELVHAVWPDTAVTDDSLIQNISAIRRALGDDPSEPRFIATLSRRGYRFLAPAEEHTDRNALVAAAPRQAEPIVAPVPSTTAPRLPAFSALGWRTVAIMAAIGLSVVPAIWLLRSESTAAARPMRFREIPPWGETINGSASLSPDSRYLAFIARNSAGVQHLWVRALDRGAAWRVEGTEGALVLPFWSPDSRYVGFVEPNHIKRVAVSGGTPVTIAATKRGPPPGVTWGADNLVLYSDQGRIFSVPDSGGASAVVLEPEPSAPSSELRWPQFLPGGRHFLVFVSSESRDQSGTYLATLGARASVKLVGGLDSPAIYAPPGYLVYVRDGIVMAQRFDVDRRQLQGQPMTVAEGVPTDAMLSATAGGLLAWSEQRTRERLVWVDRGGKELRTIDMPAVLQTFALSPDDKHLLGSSFDGGTGGMWLIDLNRKVPIRIAARAIFPAWAPDGIRFAFSAMDDKGTQVVVKSITGTPEEATWLKTDDMKLVHDWSDDGRYIVFSNYDSTWDLWLLPTFGDRKSRPFFQTPAHESDAEVSPDGRWIAYVSDETGKMEVYVQSFPVPGSKKRISTAGGRGPAWRPDSQELFYLSDDHHLMAVAFHTGDGLEPGTPELLFPATVQTFTVSSNGQRFLVVAQDTTEEPGSITLMTNWEAAQRP